MAIELPVRWKARRDLHAGSCNQPACGLHDPLELVQQLRIPLQAGDEQRGNGEAEHEGADRHGSRDDTGRGRSPPCG